MTVHAYPRLQALQAIATCIYGRRWRAPAARAMGVWLETLESWLLDRTIMPAGHIELIVRLGRMHARRCIAYCDAIERIERDPLLDS
ncbi:hypothetical protein ACCQ05_15875 [Xanthomonas sp. NCPPB 3582]|uniref:hypothetical protein n=1 Tax=Xanthomonas sp. NCPPB 3582 TaxID=487557 RepID=UPI003557DFDB